MLHIARKLDYKKHKTIPSRNAAFIPSSPPWMLDSLGHGISEVSTIALRWTHGCQYRILSPAFACRVPVVGFPYVRQVCFGRRADLDSDLPPYLPIFAHTSRSSIPRSARFPTLAHIHSTVRIPADRRRLAAERTARSTATKCSKPRTERNIDRQP